MANLWVQETYINASDKRGPAIFGESEVYETYESEVGRLFKSMQREYGRCTSSVYRDRKDAPPERIGWVFVKRKQYTDARTNGPESYYLQETWVTLHDAPPTVTREEHIHAL